MHRRQWILGIALAAASTSCEPTRTLDLRPPPMPEPAPAVAPDTAMTAAQRMVTQGRQVFRFDTFGDEAFWSDTLKLDDVIKGVRHEGLGVGLTPKAALAAGL